MICSYTNNGFDPQPSRALWRLLPVGVFVIELLPFIILPDDDGAG